MGKHIGAESSTQAGERQGEKYKNIVKIDS